MMKKIVYFPLNVVLILTLLLSGCDFLNRSPYDSVDTSQGFQTLADAEAAINAAYQPLQWAKLYNMRIWTLDIIAGNSEVGAGGGTDGEETVDLANFIADADNFAALDLWRGPSPGILRCNFVLQKVPAMNIDETIKGRILGEAHFLRAHYYFLLVRLFGGVPLQTEPADSNSDLLLPRASAEEVYELIVEDLDQAITLLPQRSAYTQEHIGRATKEAAMAELARVYLTHYQDYEHYQLVVDLCEEIRKMGYQLEANYADLWNPSKQNGVESIFEVQYYGKTNYDFWSNENQSSWLSTFTGPRNSGMAAGCYGWNQPTAEFVSQYETGDVRKEKTIFYTGCPTFDGMTYSSAYSTTGYNVRKFLLTKTQSPDYNTSNQNWVVTRYADVLLMKAEALNEMGQTTLAEAPLYEVRCRAGLTNRSTIEGLSQMQMREKIIHERRMELAFEGHRWFDMIRYKDNYALNFLHSIGKTAATSKHLLLPIPTQEREANPKLTQNPGW
ncbi:MAG: RagB/SusD family nutrient uptake outer membrane protein [Paludibacteraceae bacterium]|nr:RagB/SusD family nutrient uptake outer membrane protein [Paludibacteraceae bacterium]